MTAAVWPTGGSPASSYWKYQGRLDVSPTSTSLYDFSARDYAPGLGTFTGLDSVTGSAQSPLSLNRYLYAAADPTTLIDPDGHNTCGLVAATWEAPGVGEAIAASCVLTAAWEAAPVVVPVIAAGATAAAAAAVSSAHALGDYLSCKGCVPLETVPKWAKPEPGPAPTAVNRIRRHRPTRSSCRLTSRTSLRSTIPARNPSGSLRASEGLG